MLQFNALLREEGIEPEDVKLVRNQDTRETALTTPYDLWRANDNRFDLYQRIQERLVFEGARQVASFVATPLNETLFVGMYQIEDVAKVPPGTRDPVSGENVGGLNFYDLVPSPLLSDYRGRLTIDWGDGYRSWVQRAHKNEKPVLEIRTSAIDPPFPGFMDFRRQLNDLAAVPTSWRTALSGVKGIYLLTHPETGKQYVGSAKGIDGLWGRWQDYAASGHGGNVRMREIPAANYHISVLEVAGSAVGADAIVQSEESWKQKLLTRKFGLNVN